ncbi:hypothetical protein BHE18_15730 [Rossellomorea aquimaris]|uniref:Uncharacterized protein n=1 Tax=Rossellomorea aquimaris TaxID=189382 RepID=A0A1J6WI83_9BACI|nr:hypothetical protein BHE18_15730 [Rossellomorea aquimaris]
MYVLLKKFVEMMGGEFLGVDGVGGITGYWDGADRKSVADRRQSWSRPAAKYGFDNIIGFLIIKGTFLIIYRDF